jgi:hypothetical protein
VVGYGLEQKVDAMSYLMKETEVSPFIKGPRKPAPTKKITGIDSWYFS